MTAKLKGWSLDSFIDAMQKEISRGFVSRSFRLPILRALTPCGTYSRADLLADTFDRVLFNGITLGELPERPALCMNTTILNSGQIAKFGKDGFSAWGISVPRANPSHVVPWTDLPLARAVVASAAFPIGIPPLTLLKRDFPRGTKFSDKFAGEEVYLTDGGVLENLGVQTLLRSHRYAAWNLIASDAGVHQSPWPSRGVYGALRGFLISLLSGRNLERIMLLMNEKQNRWARQMVYGHLLISRLTDQMQKEPGDGVGMTSYTDANIRSQRRSLLFVRVAQDWNRFFRSIPRWRLAELGERVAATESVLPSSEDVSVIIDYLEDAGCNLTAAKEHYAQLGGDCGALRANEVPTGFTALSSDTVRRLALHAAWQVHAAHAIYYLDAK